MQKVLLLSLLCLVGLNICFGQISIPLTKQSIRQSGSEYEQDCLYTFDFIVNFTTKQTLKAVVDLYNEKNWVVDQTCPNCFTTKDKSSSAFVCGPTCGKPQTTDVPTRLLGDKLKVISQIIVNTDATLETYDINLQSVYDIVELKGSFRNPTDRIYLDNAQAGLGFGAEAIKSSKTSLSQIFKKFNTNKIEKQFSLFFNSEMGRLLIGKSETFFKTEEPSKSFKIVEDSTGIQSWGIKLGPYFTVKGSPDISTVDSVRPDASSTANLFTVYFDSTSKYLEFPLTTWDRLNKQMFSFNGCTVDQSGNSICDCPSKSTTWVPIGFNFVNNPAEASLENNTSQYYLNPESYLETIQGGKSSGKCLLLIKPCESKEAQEYSFGTNFLQDYYSIFNFEKKTIDLAKSHGFVPAALHLDDNYRLPFIIAGSILGVLLILLILLLLKRVKLDEQPPQEVYKPHQTTTVSYLVRSPREIESIQQITKSVKSTGPIGTPIHARVINSPYRVGYTQSQIGGIYQ